MLLSPKWSFACSLQWVNIFAWSNISLGASSLACCMQHLSVGQHDLQIYHILPHGTIAYRIGTRGTGRCHTTQGRISSWVFGKNKMDDICKTISLNEKCHILIKKFHKQSQRCYGLEPTTRTLQQIQWTWYSRNETDWNCWTMSMSNWNCINSNVSSNKFST